MKSWTNIQNRPKSTFAFTDEKESLSKSLASFLDLVIIVKFIYAHVSPVSDAPFRVFAPDSESDASLISQLGVDLHNGTIRPFTILYVVARRGKVPLV